MPYRSIGSISPRKAADMASMASAVVPPYMEARSAPSLMRSFVLPPSSLIGVPAFFIIAPNTDANWLYSFFEIPTEVAAESAQECICADEFLNTASTAPTDCSRSPASLMKFLVRAEICWMPANASAPPIATLNAEPKRLPASRPPASAWVEALENMPRKLPDTFSFRPEIAPENRAADE